MPLDPKTREQIRKRIASYARNVQRIRDDKNLSDTGKRRALARLDLTERRAIDNLKVAGEAAYRRRRAELEQKLFSVEDYLHDDVNAALSYRDAVDRISEVRGIDQARTLYNRAARSGDHLLARAVISYAWEQIGASPDGAPWAEIVHNYLDRWPGLRNVAVELGQLRDMDSKEGRLRDQITASLTRLPELHGMSDHDIGKLASEGGWTPPAESTSDAVANVKAGAAGPASPTAVQQVNEFITESRDGVHGADRLDMQLSPADPTRIPNPLR